MCVQNFVPSHLVHVEIFCWISEHFDPLVVLIKSQGMIKVMRIHHLDTIDIGT